MVAPACARLSLTDDHRWQIIPIDLSELANTGAKGIRTKEGAWLASIGDAPFLPAERSAPLAPLIYSSIDSPKFAILQLQ